MCGIVCYIGAKSIESVLLVGLTRLEYRGYDSSGIAVLENGELQVRKEKGKIKELEQLLQAYPVEGNMGIGHTRWATHGEPNRMNAHPHTNDPKTIAVVHNGILENYYTLRQELSDKGYVFHTGTDTEIIPYLIEEEIKNDDDFIKAFHRSLLRLQGTYAFAVIYDKMPNRIFFARNGSPLIFGQGQQEFFLASDIPAIVPLAKEYYMINNGEWGWVDRTEGLQLYDCTPKIISYDLHKIEIEVSDIEKGNYTHFMLKEIFEQPNVMRRIIQNRLVRDKEIFLPEKATDEEFLNRLSRIMMTSAGTSWHAALVGKMYLEQISKIATEVDVSSEFRYRNPLVDGDTKVIAISQSGETADTIASIYEAKAKFLRVLSFVNQTNSTIARESDAYVNLMAGPEIGVASTKAYTAQLLHLLLYASFLANIRSRMGEEEHQELIQQIRLLPSQMENILDRADTIRKWAYDFIETKDFVFLGRSWNYPTALEGALKLKEISYIHASGYAGGEFKHGPIALITEEVPVVCIATKSETYEKMLANIEEVKARKGKIIGLYTEGDKRVPAMADYSFAIPDCPALLSPILNVIPLQLLAYHVAVLRGCEPDQPRNLAKSVTVE